MSMAQGIQRKAPAATGIVHGETPAVMPAGTAKELRQRATAWLLARGLTEQRRKGRKQWIPC
jgi:hypothetical protein